MIQSSPGMSGFRGLKLGGGKCGGKFGDGTLKRNASNHCNKISATIVILH
jgi:hypothetical protein